MQSIDSLRELNHKLLAEISELRKKNAKLRAELKSRIKEVRNWNKIEQDSEHQRECDNIFPVDIPNSIIDQYNNVNSPPSTMSGLKLLVDRKMDAFLD
ncbi:hypothetical protein C1645_811431 [Glomus cerebriforme]|uniref:Uncharacterized protein n=1 Tax=Glomus cerebriforme TaxID=658196 RepID=A0A397TPN9_9GLOM|nr:hypothetical protein C1645_811431 [Glomus cerebriforme]